MFSNTIYYIALAAPLLPLFIFAICRNKIATGTPFLSVFLSLIAVDSLTNILNVVMDESMGNVMIIVNFSVFIQSLLIVYLYKFFNTIHNKILISTVILIAMSFVVESILKTKLLEPNTLSIIFSHTSIIILGWYILYNGYRNTSHFQFQVTAIIVLFNIVFLIKLLFQEKINDSIQLFDFVFITSSLFYLGVYLSFSRSIWSLQKNLD